MREKGDREGRGRPAHHSSELNRLRRSSKRCLLCAPAQRDRQRYARKDAQVHVGVCRDQGRPRRQTDRHVLIAPHSHSAEQKLQGFIQKTAGPLDGKPAVILILLGFVRILFVFCSTVLRFQTRSASASCSTPIQTTTVSSTRERSRLRFRSGSRSRTARTFSRSTLRPSRREGESYPSPLASLPFQFNFRTEFPSCCFISSCLDGHPLHAPSSTCM